MALTHVVSIGNSDDKLSQAEWHNFYHEVYDLVYAYAKSTYFTGTTGPTEIWQSATFVFEPWDGDENLFKSRLSEVLVTYRQDSAALVVGSTEFVTAKSSD